MLAIGCCTVVVDTDVSEPGQLETALLTRELHVERSCRLLDRRHREQHEAGRAGSRACPPDSARLAVLLPRALWTTTSTHQGVLAAPLAERDCLAQEFPKPCCTPKTPLFPAVRLLNRQFFSRASARFHPLAAAKKGNLQITNTSPPLNLAPIVYIRVT